MKVMEEKRNRQKPNYRREMDDIVAGMQKEGVRKRLLLHACCAPCSTACLELLVRFFDVTVLFYNPNITEREEYVKRLEEEKRLIALFNQGLPREEADAPRAESVIRILESRYDPEAFFAVAKGYESAPEGAERCRRCFTLRLHEAARVAADGDAACPHPFDYFTTTLTISPLKNADMLNEIGREAGMLHGVPFLPSDFKKKDGFLRSLRMSEELQLYRQDYCGCIYSKAERSCAKCRAQCT